MVKKWSTYLGDEGDEDKVKLEPENNLEGPSEQEGHVEELPHEGYHEGQGGQQLETKGTEAWIPKTFQL